MRKIINIIFLLSLNGLLFAQTGVIGSNQIICNGSGPDNLTFTTPPSGGTAPYAFRWQQSFDGSTFTDISGRVASHSVFSPPILAKTTWFRCTVTDALKVVIGNTNSVQITIRTPFTAGKISGVQTVFGGTAPNTLTQTEAPSGGGGSFNYQWQSSGDGITWSDIQGATSSDHSPTAITEDRWYRRMVINGSCGTTASNPIKVSVIPITLYTTEIPGYNSYNWTRMDWGTQFRVLTDGFITKVRLYTGVDETGVHTIRLWVSNGSDYTLIAGPYTWNISSVYEGWQVFDLPSARAVTAGHDYVVSITNEDPGQYWAQSSNFSPPPSNNYVTYVAGARAYTPGDNHFELRIDAGDSYFRDIVFIPFSPGSAGTAQPVCYNSAPSTLAQITAPTGGSGTYTYQWQSSPDGSIWTNVPGATSPQYSPPALTANTYYRRVVTSGTLTANCSPVLITVDPQLTLAQLHDNITIYQNTSTYLNAVISGGTPPYTITYTRDGITQTPVLNYVSGTDIFTGVLASGGHIFALTNVTDALGCVPQSLGTSVTVTASGSHSGSITNKALVIINSNSLSLYYLNFNDWIKPYLDWFGIPYDICDINSTQLPDLNNYALIIFGHREVYKDTYPESQQAYPFATLESALNSGVGLYSFDPHLFDFESGFNAPAGQTYPFFYANHIGIMTDHYITQYHANDAYNPANNSIDAYVYGESLPIHIFSYSFDLVGATTLATADNGSDNEPLLQVANYGNGRIVRWSAYLWIQANIVGPVRGMDDLIWRGIVWAAKKPFVMQGMPPMITMRIDDVDGSGGNIGTNLRWLKISNEFGFIPWCGTFNSTMPQTAIDTLRYLINNNLATASPHAFSSNDYIYYNAHDLPDFSASANVIAARSFYTTNSLTMSKYLIAHSYLMSSEALAEIHNMGIEYIGMPILYNQLYNGDHNWLHAGPYRLNQTGNPTGNSPVFYAGAVTWLGNNFFISLSEMRDDSYYGYEWYPDIDDVQTTIARGVRHLRRGLNSMILPTLFTHEYDRLTHITSSNWRSILSGVTSAIAPYNPEYRSMDYAVQYERAKVNIKITNVTDDNNIVNISCSGINDMETRCYLFTGSGNQITSRLVTLPRVNSASIPVTVGVLK
jgi:hypothetical protein